MELVHRQAPPPLAGVKTQCKLASSTHEHHHHRLVGAVGRDVACCAKICGKQSCRLLEEIGFARVQLVV